MILYFFYVIVFIFIECDDGLYGQNCNKNCSGISGHCMNITSCNHVTGQCDNGCSHGWHGPYCEHRCKGHCKHNVTCNHVTGLCEEGCAAGWNGSDCNQGIFIQCSFLNDVLLFI